MPKKKRNARSGEPGEQRDKPATLRDVMKPDVLAKLREQAGAVQAEQERKREEARRQAEKDRQAEQERLENDFQYLLETSRQDWRKFK